MIIIIDVILGRQNDKMYMFDWCSRMCTQTGTVFGDSPTENGPDTDVSSVSSFVPNVNCVGNYKWPRRTETLTHIHIRFRGSHEHFVSCAVSSQACAARINFSILASIHLTTGTANMNKYVQGTKSVSQTERTRSNVPRAANE